MTKSLFHDDIKKTTRRKLYRKRIRQARSYYAKRLKVFIKAKSQPIDFTTLE